MQSFNICDVLATEPPMLRISLLERTENREKRREFLLKIRTMPIRIHKWITEYQNVALLSHLSTMSQLKPQ